MKYAFLWLALLVFCAEIAAQQNDSVAKHEWTIKWNATAAIDGFSFPTIQFAVERQLSDYFSAQVEYGVQAYAINRKNADTISVGTSGFRFLAEGRFYPFKYFGRKRGTQTEAAAIFTGLQMGYRKNYYDERFSYTPLGNNSVAYEDDFGVSKEVIALNITIGVRSELGKHFVIEPYIAIGTLKRNIRNFNRTYDPEIHLEYDNDPHGFINQYDLEEKSGSDGNFAFGMRVGYRF